MSSPGSVALILDLPAELLADRVTVGLCFACAICVEWVAARYPGAPFGAGLMLGGLTLAWNRARLGRRPALRRATVSHDDWWQLEFADGCRAPARLLGESRILGPTLVLRWDVGGRVSGAWLTGLDVATPRLREIALRIRTARRGHPA